MGGNDRAIGWFLAAIRCRPRGNSVLLSPISTSRSSPTAASMNGLAPRGGERALYGAYRAQQERSMVVRRMAEQARREGRSGA
jgi:hypothetical protein